MTNILEDKYYDKYRDVTYEIRNWRFVGKHITWNYYVYLKDWMLPPEIWKGLWVEDFQYLDSALENIPMHGGISFCKRDHDNQIIEIGCDYCHDFDSDVEYTVDKIVVEVKETIDYILDKMGVTMKMGTCDKHEGVQIEYESLECPLCRLQNVEKELEQKRQSLIDADEWIADLEAQLGANLRH